MKKKFLCLVTLLFLGSGVGYAETYTDSAHGNSTYGVDRTSTAQYATGHCAHCHEQHASIGGDEPAPDNDAPSNYLLFDTSHTSQIANFCFDCHVDTGAQQSGGFIKNYSYSYRAGNYNDDIDDIKQAFGVTNASSHNLDNILTFITSKWGYTANSNPCSACHNPHATQGDPAGSTSAKSISSRGYPVSRPSLHANLTSWGLWGDAAGEKMSDYSNHYQAPYRFNKTTEEYEPDGSTTTNGTNLTDYVTFCLDCHNSTYGDMRAAPYNLSHTPIDWDATSGDYHGNKNGEGKKEAPYIVAKNYVLACTDCHEPHGSDSYGYKIRKEVNGATTTFNGNTRDAWDSLCDRCHTSKLTEPYCPEDDSGATLCSNCHSHGLNF